MAARADRALELVAQRQARRRAFNERLARVGPPPDEVLIRCECGLIGCGAALRLQPAEYEELRAHRRRFAALASHVIPEAEAVVSSHGTWVTIEKPVDPPVCDPGNVETGRFETPH
jgi:hypothetical protein